MAKTMFKCVVCGKITAGRIPRDGRHHGDKSARFPRRHKNKDGTPCAGNIEEAEWIDIKEKSDAKNNSPNPDRPSSL